MKKNKILLSIIFVILLAPMILILLSNLNIKNNNDNKYKKLEDKISILIEDNNKLKNDLNDVKDNVNLENLSNLESKLAILEANLTKIESDLESIGSNEELINEINNLKIEVNNLKAELNSLKDDVEESKLHHFALVGSMNSWDVSDTTYLMDTEDNVVFTYTLDNPNGDVLEFKLADNCSWTWEYGSQAVITKDTDYLKLDGENIIINKPGKYDLTLNVKTHELDITQTEIYKLDINIDLPDTMTLTPGLDGDPSIDVPEYVSYRLMYFYEDGSYRGDSSVGTLNPGTYTLKFFIDEGNYNNRNSKDIIVEVLDYVDTNEFTLVGSFNNWTVEDTTYPLELTSPSNYVCYVYLEEGTQFKIVNHLSWDESYGYDENNFSIGGSSDCFSGVDGNIQCNYSNVYYVSFSSYNNLIFIGSTNYEEIDGKYYVIEHGSNSLTGGEWRFNDIYYYNGGFGLAANITDSLGNEYNSLSIGGDQLSLSLLGEPNEFDERETIKCNYIYGSNDDIEYLAINEDGSFKNDFYIIFNEIITDDDFYKSKLLEILNTFAYKYVEVLH